MAKIRCKVEYHKIYIPARHKKDGTLVDPARMANVSAKDYKMRSPQYRKAYNMSSSHSGRSKIVRHNSHTTVGSWRFGQKRWLKAHGVFRALMMDKKASTKLHQEIMRRLQKAQKDVMDLIESSAGWQDLTGNAFESMSSAIYTTRQQLAFSNIKHTKGGQKVYSNKINAGNFKTAREKKAQKHIIRRAGDGAYVYVDPLHLPFGGMPTTGGRALPEVRQMLRNYRPDPYYHTYGDFQEVGERYEMAIKSGVEYEDKLKAVNGQYFINFMQKQARKIMESYLAGISFDSIKDWRIAY